MIMTETTFMMAMICECSAVRCAARALTIDFANRPTLTLHACMHRCPRATPPNVSSPSYLSRGLAPRPNVYISPAFPVSPILSFPRHIHIQVLADRYGTGPLDSASSRLARIVFTVHFHLISLSSSSPSRASCPAVLVDASVIAYSSRAMLYHTEEGKVRESAGLRDGRPPCSVRMVRLTVSRRTNQSPGICSHDQRQPQPGLHCARACGAVDTSSIEGMPR